MTGHTSCRLILSGNWVRVWRVNLTFVQRFDQRTNARSHRLVLVVEAVFSIHEVHNHAAASQWTHVSPHGLSFKQAAGIDT
jgi:hypothetical protein